MILEHLNFAFHDAHLFQDFSLSSSLYKLSRFFCTHTLPIVFEFSIVRGLRVLIQQQCHLPRRSAGLVLEQPWVEGVDSNFYLPISLWILLQYWQTDSQGLWVDRSSLSAGYHFQLNPFILTYSQLLGQQRKESISTGLHFYQNGPCNCRGRAAFSSITVLEISWSEKLGHLRWSRSAKRDKLSKLLGIDTLACLLRHVYRHKDLFVLRCSDTAHCGRRGF